MRYICFDNISSWRSKYALRKSKIAPPHTRTILGIGERIYKTKKISLNELHLDCTKMFALGPKPEVLEQKTFQLPL